MRTIDWVPFLLLGWLAAGCAVAALFGGWVRADRRAETRWRATPEPTRLRLVGAPPFDQDAA